MKSTISRWTKAISSGVFSRIPQTQPRRFLGAVFLVTALASTPAAAGPGGPGIGPCADCGDPPLWGFADLHTHPASNYAFGGDEFGENGIIHGKPGLAFTADKNVEDQNLASDLPSCDTDQHGDIWWDLIKGGTRSESLSALEGSPGGNHLLGGYKNDFFGWPDARSITHQQMHVQWLHRAWEGGLRLMVASTVDNQVLAALRGKDWFQLFGNELGDVVKKDYASARLQLQAIEDMADHNSQWMAIARSGAEARQIIAAGKLALVLGLEQDSLSIDNILDLRDEFGVTVVHPIHLVNNDLGGTAVYSDLFDVATKTLTTEHVEVEFDPSVRFRFGAPHYLDDQILPYVNVSPDPLPDLIVTPVDENDWQCDMKWESCDLQNSPPTVMGHRNVLGLTDAGRTGVAKLLNKGMILDLAHMGDKARADVLDLADTCQRPVIDSHTALRLDLTNPAHATDPERREASERDLPEDLALRIANGGGIVGLGTAGSLQPVPLFRAEGEPLERMGNPGFDPDLVATQTWQFNEAHLRIALHTGKDEMRGVHQDLDPDAAVQATMAPAPEQRFMGSGWPARQAQRLASMTSASAIWGRMDVCFAMPSTQQWPTTVLTTNIWWYGRVRTSWPRQVQTPESMKSTASGGAPVAMAW